MLDIQILNENTHVPVTVIRPTGRIDSASFQVFQASVDEQIANGARQILIDLAGVSYLSSAGLRVIHNTFNKLRGIHQDVNDDELRKRMSAGGYKSPYLKICNPAPDIATVFQMGGFDIYIDIFADTQSALNSF